MIEPIPVAVCSKYSRTRRKRPLQNIRAFKLAIVEVLEKTKLETRVQVVDRMRSTRTVANMRRTTAHLILGATHSCISARGSRARVAEVTYYEHSSNQIFTSNELHKKRGLCYGKYQIPR